MTHTPTNSNEIICPNCQTKNNQNNVYCASCHMRLKHPSKTIPRVEGETFTRFKWLGFFLPPLGLILFLTWKDTHKAKAVAAGSGALISVIIIILGFLAYVSLMIGVFGTE